MSWPRRMRSQSVRISSLNWSVGGWRVWGGDPWASVLAGAGAGLQGGLSCGERPGLGRGRGGGLVPTRVQDSESQGGDRVRAAAPGADRLAEWSLRGSDPQNLTGCSWESRMVRGREARGGRGGGRCLAQTDELCWGQRAFPESPRLPQNLSC